MRNPYEVLGLDKNCTLEEINDRYRILSKEFHPDMENGDKEKFTEINNAVQLLRDPERRKLLDDHGIADSGKETIASMVHNIVRELISQWVNAVIETDADEEIQEFLTRTINIKNKLCKEAMKVAEKRLKVARKKIQYISKDDNQLLFSIMTQKIKSIEDSIEKVKKEVFIGNLIKAECQKFETKTPVENSATIPPDVLIDHLMRNNPFFNGTRSTSY